MINTKRGGPYSKKEQQERRDAVGEMFYAKGMSIQQISKELRVNRNTISDDLKIIKKETASNYNLDIIRDHCIEQIEALKAQKNRLIKMLDGLGLDAALKVEKMILEVSLKIVHMISEITVAKKDEMIEGEFAEILRTMCLFDGIGLPMVCNQDQIRKAVIEIVHGNKAKADQFWDMMEKMGISYFSHRGMPASYCLLDFALAIQIITKDECDKVRQRIIGQLNKEVNETNGILEKYELKYGQDARKWPPGTLEQMNQELDG